MQGFSTFTTYTAFHGYVLNRDACTIHICYTYVLYMYDIISVYYIIKGSLDEKLPSYEVLKMLKE